MHDSIFRTITEWKNENYKLLHNSLEVRVPPECLNIWTILPLTNYKHVQWTTTTIFPLEQKKISLLPGLPTYC